MGSFWGKFPFTGRGDTFLPKFITWIQSWRTSEKPELQDRKQLTYTQEPSGTSMKMKADMPRKAEFKDGDHPGSWQLCFATELINLRSKTSAGIYMIYCLSQMNFSFYSIYKKVIFIWHTGVSSWGCSWVAPRGPGHPRLLSCCPSVWGDQYFRALQPTCCTLLPLGILAGKCWLKPVSWAFCSCSSKHPTIW